MDQSRIKGIALVGVVFIAGMLGSCAPLADEVGAGVRARPPRPTPPRSVDNTLPVSPSSATSSGAIPVQMFLSRGTPMDTDANGYPDMIPVVVYLFEAQDRSPLPVWADGSFRFALGTETGEPIGSWVFEGQSAVVARKRLAPGPAYAFFLKLGADEDKLPSMTAEITGVFEHVSGRKAPSMGSATVRLGGGR